MLAITAIIVSLATTALAQASTTAVFLPIVDAQALVASLSRESGGVKTMIVECPNGTDSSRCGFPTPVTVTAGPSTLGLTTTIANSVVVDLKCGVEGSTKASCTQIYTGPASLYTSGDGIDGAKTTTWTASQSLDSGKVTYLPVTITGGLPTSTISRGRAGAIPTAGWSEVLGAGLVANIAAAVVL